VAAKSDSKEQGDRKVAEHTKDFIFAYFNFTKELRGVGVSTPVSCFGGPDVVSLTNVSRLPLVSSGDCRDTILK
jgi:hypothetical protein